MNRATRILASAAVVCLGAAAAHAQKAYIDYDRTVDLSKYQTYAFAKTDAGDTLATRAPLAHQHLLDALDQRLQASGQLRKVESNPDVWVTYHVTSQEEATLTTTGYGMGPGWGGGYYWAGGWGGGAWASSTTTVNTYTVGTVIIDIWDAKTEKAVWRGIVSAVVPENPKKGIKKIDTALDKLLKKWQEMRKKGE
jgi:hypothetical protein